jgi:hypothetical protein
MSKPRVISSRSDLFSLLSEACELEHGLACSYLYSAFTLKRDLSEGGLTWQQLQKVRLWAAQIYYVASQEMLHLTQAWNLLAAIGGTPYYSRPNFPQGSKYYPLHLPLSLEPFGHKAIRRFIFYESPVEVTPERSFARELKVAVDEPVPFEFHTVGQLYELIRSAFRSIPESQLFIGPTEKQMGQELVDFPDIVKVHDRKSAEAAINNITHQGEGTDRDRVDCHFGIFHKILADLELEEKESRHRKELFLPARNVIENPAAQNRGDYGAPEAKQIEDPYTRNVAELFDSVYSMMLRMLSYVSGSNTGDIAFLQRFASFAIAAMPSVILPLGEALTLLPAGPSYGDRTAGPGFGMSRHVPLPATADLALILVKEQMTELEQVLAELAAAPNAPAQLGNAHRRFVDLIAKV